MLVIVLWKAALRFRRLSCHKNKPLSILLSDFHNWSKQLFGLPHIFVICVCLLFVWSCLIFKIDKIQLHNKSVHQTCIYFFYCTDWNVSKSVPKKYWKLGLNTWSDTYSFDQICHDLNHIYLDFILFQVSARLHCVTVR